MVGEYHDRLHLLFYKFKIKKDMKKIAFILICLSMFLGSFAQRASKIHTSKTVNQGEYVAFNVNKTDTLYTNDTLTFVFPVQHINDVAPVAALTYHYVGTADTTITMTVFASMDGVNYYAVNYGAVGTSSAYTKTVAKGSATIEYNGASDAAWFQARYLKLMFISKPKSGFKKVLSGYIKFVIK